MSRTLLIAVSPGELWAVLADDDTPIELRVLRPGAEAGIGELRLGRVVALRPELPAALVDIGLARPAFLSAEDALPGAGIAGLHEGQALLVQVAKEARADKAAGVTLRPRLAGRLLDLVLAGRPGITADRRIEPAEAARLADLMAGIARPDEAFVLRPAAAGAVMAGLAAEAAALRARWQAIVGAAAGEVRPPARLEAPPPPLALLLQEIGEPAPEAIILDDRAAFAAARGWLTRHRPDLAGRVALHAGGAPLFEHYGVAAAIETALAPRVGLAEGGAITVETTAVATLIDVDSGTGARRRSAAAAAALAVNLAAAREVARQIRLRNLAGPIIVDFVGMERRGDRARVSEALAAALADDPAGCAVLGWTRLGHLELVRKRRHRPLAELLFERMPGGGLVRTPLTVALDALRATAREAAAMPGRPLAAHVAPEVAEALSAEAGEARRELETRLGRSLAVVAEPGRARETFDIRPA